MHELQDRVVFVSGAGSGIGAALAHEVAGRGAKVAVTDVRADAARAVAEEIADGGGTALALELDVTSAESWQFAVDRAEEHLGPIALLCSNAGVGPTPSPVLDLPADYMRWMFEVNYFGGFHGAQCVAPRMRDRGEGHLLFTASVAGFTAGGQQLGYTTSKHMLVLLAEALHSELEPAGVGVTILCPAAVATGLSESTHDRIPEAFANVMTGTHFSLLDPALAEQLAAVGGVLAPAVVAHRAIDGVVNGALYVFTHPESRAMTLARTDAVEQVFDRMDATSA